MKVSFNLVQNVLGGASKKNGAGLGILAFCDERKVFVSDFVNIEEPRLGSNI